MNFKEWSWWAYFLIFSIFTARHLANLFSNTSTPYIYYHTLLTFNCDYTALYFLGIISAVINAACLVPLFLFILKTRLFHPGLWQWLFILRIIFDFIGNFYELNFLKSLLYARHELLVQAVVIMIALLGPSYVACFRYAFRQDKIFPQSKSS